MLGMVPYSGTDSSSKRLQLYKHRATQTSKINNQKSDGSDGEINDRSGDQCVS